MAQFEQHFVQDLTQPIKIRHCGTIVFNADDESNVISVRLFNGSEPVAISGSVVGAVVCSDGATVTLAGSYSGNTASITLTGDCFAVLGQIGVGIQIVNGTQKTTVLKAIYNVETLTTENVVDPGSRITLEVGDLIDDIETAVASIPADYSDLLAAIAPNYSGLTFPVKAGTFCWYNGALYQAQQDIATSEAWTAAHWASAILTTSLDEKLADVDDEIGDLKSAVTQDFINIGITLTDGKYIKISDGYNNTSSSFSYTNYFIDISAYDTLYITVPVSANSYHSTVAAGIAFYTTNAYDDYLSSDYVAFQAGSANGYDYEFITIPDTACYMRVSTLATLASAFEAKGRLKKTEVAIDSAALALTTSNHVIVIQNDSDYGDGGVCCYAVRSGETTSGISRSDSTVVYPIANQGILKNSNAPYHKIMDVIKSYVGVSGLTYGNDYTLYDTTCTDEIDCSSFVTAVLNGVTYNNSRYVLGTNESNIIGEHVGDTRLAISGGQWTRLLSYNMAQWFACRRQLFELPASAVRAVQMLQFGDILFSGTTTENYYGINHCMVVIGVIPNSCAVIVAQSGGSGEYINYSTTVKTACIVLTNDTIASTYKVFARPSYAPDYGGTSYMHAFNEFSSTGSYVFSEKTGLKFQQNTILASATGLLTTYETYAATPEFYEVEPLQELTYIGATAGNSTAYVAGVAQYDENKKFISKSSILVSTGGTSTVTLSSTAKYVRFDFGHLESTAVPMTLANFEDFKVKIEFV